MGRTRTWGKYIPQSDNTAVDATDAVHFECLYSVVDVAADTTTVYNGPALLFGVYVNTVLSAHACPITDAGTTVVTLPATAAAGTYYPFPGIRFETTLIVDPNNSGSGNITVFYRPI